MIGGFYAPVDQRVKFESGSKKDLWQMENENLFGTHTFFISLANQQLHKFSLTISELKAIFFFDFQLSKPRNVIFGFFNLLP